MRTVISGKVFRDVGQIKGLTLGWPKPHIYRSANGDWVCHRFSGLANTVVGRGKTPVAAYAECMSIH